MELEFNFNIFAALIFADNMKNMVVAKLVHQCSDLYADAMKQMQLGTLRDIWPKVCTFIAFSEGRVSRIALLEVRASYIGLSEVRASYIALSVLNWFINVLISASIQ